MKAKQIHDTLATNSSLRVIDIDPQSDLRWKDLATKIPACPSLIYHPAWLKVLEEAYSYKPVHLACEDSGGQLVGILPLFYRRGWHTGRRLTSVLSGPLATDDRTSAALVRAAIERTHAETGVQLRLNMMSNTFDGQVDGMVGVPACETYLLALPERPDLLRLNSSIKRAVNKATRSGVQVRQAQTEHELRAWYGLYLHTTRKLLITPKPYRFFELAWERLHSQGLLRLLLAERIEAGQRRLLAGSLYLMWGQTVSCYMEGWRQEDQAFRPNDVLHWQAIQDACTDGFRWYDFADVDLGNEGLARYKSKWGTEAKMIYSYSYPVPHNGMSGTHDSPKHSAHPLVDAARQRLPVKVIGLLSDWYYALHLY